MMKKYITIFLVTGISYGCNNTKDPSSVTSVNRDTAQRQIPTKDTSAVSAESIFSITDTFQSQNKKNFVLSSLKGKPTVVGMIFTSCGYACPRLTSDMRNIAGELKGDRARVNFVQVSFDTDRDNPDELKKFAKQMGLDDNWILLHGSEETVRTLSVLLNVQFEKDAEGNFSHSNVISVLDKNGVLAFQKEGLEADHDETMGKIEDLLK